MRLAHADTDCIGFRVRDYLLVMLMFTDMHCTFPVWKVSRISSRRNRLCAVCGSLHSIRVAYALTPIVMKEQ